MKKQLIFIILCMVTVLSAAAKAGDRFEWYPYDDPYQDSGVVVLEVLSDENKTMKIVEIHPPNKNKPINYIMTPGRFLSPLPNGYQDYRITEIRSRAFDNLSWGKEVEIITIHNVPVIGDYAFWGSCMPFTIKNGFEHSLSINLYNVVSIGEYAFANSEIDRISVHSLIPPDVHRNSFPEKAYEECQLHIPYGTWAAYFYHPVWGRFKNLQTAFDSVDDIETNEAQYRVSGNEITVSGAADGTTIRIYDLTGRCVDMIEFQSENNNILTTPSAGIYILQYAGKTHKIMIRP